MKMICNVKAYQSVVELIGVIASTKAKIVYGK